MGLAIVRNFIKAHTKIRDPSEYRNPLPPEKKLKSPLAPISKKCPDLTGFWHQRLPLTRGHDPPLVSMFY